MVPNIQILIDLWVEFCFIGFSVKRYRASRIYQELFIAYSKHHRNLIEISGNKLSISEIIRYTFYFKNNALLYEKFSNKYSLVK